MRMASKLGTNLEYIDTLPCDVAVDLILLVEMSAEHLGRLVNGVLDLDSDTTSSLRFLDDLGEV